MGNALPFVDLGAGRTVVQVSCGGMDDTNYGYWSGTTCAVFDNGKLKCWGYNRDGRIGLGRLGDVGVLASQMGDNLPYIDLGSQGFDVVQVAPGEHHICALLANKRVKCWGSDEHGSTGRGTSWTVFGDVASEMGDGLPFLELADDVEAVSAGCHENSVIFKDGSVRVSCEHAGQSWEVVLPKASPGLLPCCQQAPCLWQLMKGTTCYAV